MTFFYHLLQYILYIRFISLASKYNPDIYKKEFSVEDLLIALKKIRSIVGILVYIKPPEIINTVYSESVIKNELLFLGLRLREIQSDIQSTINTQTKILKSTQSEIQEVIH
jgi:hypothetical protein